MHQGRLELPTLTKEPQLYRLLPNRLGVWCVQENSRRGQGWDDPARVAFKAIRFSNNRKERAFRLPTGSRPAPVCLYELS